MATGGESCAANVANHLALLDMLTYANYVAARVVVASRHVPAAKMAVVDHQPVAVADVVVPLGDPTGSGSPDWSAARSTEIRTVMQLPIAQHRVEAHAEG
jgi:hypothetical protein